MGIEIVDSREMNRVEIDPELHKSSAAHTRPRSRAKSGRTRGLVDEL
jgi:hypothetical protein